MEPTSQQLREHYAKLSDDELVAIYAGSDLTEIARSMIETEIALRGISRDDVIAAKSAATGLEEVREAGRRRASRAVWWFIFVILILFLAPFVAKLIRSINS